jgi:hypothetical protein
VIYLTLPELLHVAGRVLGPDVAVRDYGLLQAALARPQAAVFGKDADPSLDAKAAALLHSLARSHALIDSGKRPALAAVIASMASTAAVLRSPTTRPTIWSLWLPRASLTRWRRSRRFSRPLPHPASNAVRISTRKPRGCLGRWPAASTAANR